MNKKIVFIICLIAIVIGCIGFVVGLFLPINQKETIIPFSAALVLLGLIPSFIDSLNKMFTNRND